MTGACKPRNKVEVSNLTAEKLTRVATEEDLTETWALATEEDLTETWASPGQSPAERELSTLAVRDNA